MTSLGVFMTFDMCTRTAAAPSSARPPAFPAPVDFIEDGPAPVRAARAE